MRREQGVRTPTSLEQPRGHLANTRLFTVLTEPWPVKFSRKTNANLREQGLCQ